MLGGFWGKGGDAGGVGAAIAAAKELEAFDPVLAEEASPAVGGVWVGAELGDGTELDPGPAAGPLTTPPAVSPTGPGAPPATPPMAAPTGAGTLD